MTYWELSKLELSMFPTLLVYIYITNIEYIMMLLTLISDISIQYMTEPDLEMIQHRFVIKCGHPTRFLPVF